MCRECFLRTTGKAGNCRGCGSSLQECLHIYPCQWPPIGASPSMISKYEPSAPPPQGTAESTPAPARGDDPMQTAPPASAALSDEPADLTQQQLRAEIARLESMLQGWTAMLPTLRKQVEESLALARRELSGRKTTGRTLDQAEHRYRQTQQATQHTEDHLSKSQEALQLAQSALSRESQGERTECAQGSNCGVGAPPPSAASRIAASGASVKKFIGAKLWGGGV